MSQAKLWDEYEIKARYIPCFVGAVFPVHFAVEFLGNAFWVALTKNVAWMFVTNLSISVVVTLALIQLQCGIAKHWVEEGIFGKGGIRFPTTTLLLFEDSFLSREMKLAIRDKIKQNFNFILMNETQEKADPQEAKKLAREAVGFIRRYVGKGVMTYQYNIRYGFMRNLIGGAIWAFFGSLGCAIWYGSQNSLPAFSMFTVFAIGYASLALYREEILYKFAHNYAEILFNEYMVKKGSGS